MQLLLIIDKNKGIFVVLKQNNIRALHVKTENNIYRLFV